MDAVIVADLLLKAFQLADALGDYEIIVSEVAQMEAAGATPEQVSAWLVEQRNAASIEAHKMN